MKKFYIEWETVYNEDFPERVGAVVIEAETEEEAAEKFYKGKIQTIITEIKELKG